MMYLFHLLVLVLAATCHVMLNADTRPVQISSSDPCFELAGLNRDVAVVVSDFSARVLAAFRDVGRGLGTLGRHVGIKTCKILAYMDEFVCNARAAGLNWYKRSLDYTECKKIALKQEIHQFSTAVKKFDYQGTAARMYSSLGKSVSIWIAAPLSSVSEEFGNYVSVLFVKAQDAISETFDKLVSVLFDAPGVLSETFGHLVSMLFEGSLSVISEVSGKVVSVLFAAQGAISETFGKLASVSYEAPLSAVFEVFGKFVSALSVAQDVFSETFGKLTSALSVAQDVFSETFGKLTSASFEALGALSETYGKFASVFIGARGVDWT